MILSFRQKNPCHDGLVLELFGLAAHVIIMIIVVMIKKMIEEYVP